MDPPLPANESARLDALRRYNVLDTLQESPFDDITRLAAQYCQTPVALISFVDENRQWFKSRHGTVLEETPRNISFCAYSILQTDVFVVSDAQADARFAANPLVMKDPKVRFYAAAPLVTPDGFVLGTLCVVDMVPRQLTAEQLDALQILSKQVIAQLELGYTGRTRMNAFAELGYHLSAANTPTEAARIVVKTAKNLLKWDACSLDLYLPESNRIMPVLSMDTLDDQCIEVPHAYTGKAPSPMAEKTIRDGGQRILRDASSSSSDTMGLTPFGDVSRPSASLMFVPIRSGDKIVGVLSVQSYTPQAYTADDLTALQALADHCGGAMERIQISETLRASETVERRSREKLTALLSVVNELSKYRFEEMLCRRAIELGRSDLGFDRLGIWFLDAQTSTAEGSFGVDENGQLRDERGSRITADFASDMAQMLTRQKPYLYEEDGPILNDHAEVIGQGFHAMAPLWDGEKAIGYLSTDNFLRHEPITERDCELLTLYATTLGHLCARVRSGEALRAEKRFADTAIDSLPGIFYFFDSQGKLLRWNQNFESVSGYSPDEIASMHPLDFFTGADKEQIADRMARAFEEGSSTAQASYITKDGRSIPYFFTAQLTHIDSQPYLVGTGIDVSDRKRLEEQLLQAQKMEGIGRLAGGIAHDFNNLLTAILGFADLTLEELTEAHPAYTYVENVQKAARRAETLTGQLLAFARKQIIEARVVSLNDLILDTGKILRRLIGEDIELIILPRQDLWLVKADLSQLSQVLINLAVNARDAMPHGGKITIETANITLDEDYARTHADIKPGDHVMLAVSDTGVGMDSSVQQHIFEPFFTTKEMGKGTGLGLATCYGIVKQSGGHIWLYSEPGQGTTFKIYLPRVAETAAEESHSSEEREAWLGTETILLVEDELLVLDLAARALRSRGYTVFEASSGADALRLASEYEGRLDLVVTDVVMPQMSGRVLTERLHILYPQVRVLYASGYTDDSIIHHGVLEEGIAFLQKPYTPTTLARKVREVLDSD